MTKKIDSNSQLPLSTSTAGCRIAQPSSEFYSIFSQEEILGIIDALELRREIPLKYSYKGRGGKIWDNFYLKYITPRWYRASSTEIDLLKENFECINDYAQNCQKVNIVDVGAGNSYPVKEFVTRLNKLGRMNKYIALDISEELLRVSRENFKKWFPKIDFSSYQIDIENNFLAKILLEDQANLEPEHTAQIFFHLGVTMGNHQNRAGVFRNFRDSMNKNDLLIFTNEIGSSSQWDGRARGGLKYHVEPVYSWIKNELGIRAEDCELVRKYDDKIDSIVATIKLHHPYTLNFSFGKIDKSVEMAEGEEITIWRQHKYELPELQQDIERSGLQIVHYSTDKYLSNVMVICEVASH
ncbi:L-histidine N(alpha)-methyltransferase [Allocoleopsis franciscana]|uniref:Histidine-specific methyltransferase SAM-dependent domain-containing protein n=1 Tax=Allocoleopsis franciscana PCC 7113 TaxID=1173027 RepID=K9WMF0_9CYAN|nr:L-histidine N(alpha)-methyltransferase [Allocoleopsis franciscana]AFZ21560.1 hypothetical protein Mic7113_5957 [Allocoleopsis franciscana PCC 7113]